MRSYLGPAALALGLGVATHLAIIFAAPNVLMDRAMERISQQGRLINTWIHPPRVSEESRRVVRPSPDIAYSACIYDLSDGPVHVTASPWDAYMSVSVFANNSDNIYVVNDRDAPDGADLWIVRRQSDAPEGANDVVVSPSAKGIVLQRRIAPTAERFALADAARRQDICETASR